MWLCILIGRPFLSNLSGGRSNMFMGWCYMQMYFIVQFCIVLFSWYCIVLYGIARCYMLLHGIAWQYFIVFYGILWYFMASINLIFWGKMPSYIVVHGTWYHGTITSFYYDLFFCVTVLYGDGISLPSRQGSPKSLRNLIPGTICWGNFCFGNLGNTVSMIITPCQ